MFIMFLPAKGGMWISIQVLDDVLRYSSQSKKCCMASNIRTGEYSQLSRPYAFFRWELIGSTCIFSLIFTPFALHILP
jgi:hypothetical protein